MDQSKVASASANRARAAASARSRPTQAKQAAGVPGLPGVTREDLTPWAMMAGYEPRRDTDGETIVLAPLGYAGRPTRKTS